MKKSFLSSVYVNTDLKNRSERYRAPRARILEERRSKDESFLLQNQKRERKEEDDLLGRITYRNVLDEDRQMAAELITYNHKSIY